MSTIRNICVYCGSEAGTDPSFLKAATEFGAVLAAHDIGLVYGGGSVGLMGEVAASTIAKGGHVIGVIPEFLAGRERLNDSVHELIVTRDMHERKRVMFERADAFVAMPGGIGTLEELVEQLTWAQLGRHKKPILLLNTRGFWNPLIELFNHMTTLGFIHSAQLFRYLVADEVKDVLPMVTKAAASILEDEKLMQAGIAERL
jgi:uncharacterized protein (TIGR00730 family)